MRIVAQWEASTTLDTLLGAHACLGDNLVHPQSSLIRIAWSRRGVAKTADEHFDRRTLVDLAVALSRPGDDGGGSKIGAKATWLEEEDADTERS